MKTSTKPSATSSTCVAKSITASVTESLAASETPTMLSATSTTITTRRRRCPTDSPQGPPEDREVMRNEERRNGNGHDVHEHLRPRCGEGDELVERVPRKARRSAGFRVAHRALAVGGRRAGEDQSGNDEDDRRQAERVDSREAECVVDRGADVPVGGGEERGRAEYPLELHLPTSAAGHRRTLLVRRYGICGSRSRRAKTKGSLRTALPSHDPRSAEADHGSQPLKGRFAPSEASGIALVWIDPVGSSRRPRSLHSLALVSTVVIIRPSAA